VNPPEKEVSTEKKTCNEKGSTGKTSRKGWIEHNHLKAITQKTPGRSHTKGLTVREGVGVGSGDQVGLEETLTGGPELFSQAKRRGPSPRKLNEKGAMGAS